MVFLEVNVLFDCHIEYILQCKTLPNKMTEVEQEEMLKEFKKHMNPKIYQ